MKKLMCGSVVALSAVLFADPATGWLQTAAGTYDFNDTANWVNGEINGIFGADLAIEGDQIIDITTDTTLADGLSVKQTGAYKITFNSLSSGATLTLGGDIEFDAAGMTGFESGLKIDLGGAVRTIRTGVKDTWISAPMSNGGVVYANAGKLAVWSANTYEGGTWVKGPGKLQMSNVLMFGAAISDIHLCEGAWLYSSQKNGQMTVGNANRVYIEGDCTLGQDGKDLGGVNFRDSPMIVSKPVKITLSRNSSTFGPLSVSSPCGWGDVEILSGNSNLATLSFSSLVLGADETLKVTSTYLSLPASEGEGAIEMWGDSTLTINDSNANPNLTMKLRNGAKLTLATSVGGARAPLGKIVCGGGTIAFSGAKDQVTVYTVPLEIDNVMGSPNVVPTVTSGQVSTTFLASPFVKGPGAMMALGATVDGSAIAVKIDGHEAAEIVPWARGVAGEFISYDASRGLVRLDTAGANCVTYAEGMTSSDLADKVVYIPTGKTFTPDADVSVKALSVSGSSAGLGSSDYTVTVTSGAVCLDAMGTLTIASPVAFGTNRGYIHFSCNNYSHVQNWQAGISGTAGVTFADLRANYAYAKDWKGLNILAATSFSGDAYLNGVVYCRAANCLPNGAERPGNVYVESCCNFWKAANMDIQVNGLYGSGSFSKDSGAITLTIGSDGSDGIFDGSSTEGKQIMINKVGSGKQVMNGAVTHAYGTTVTEGTLELNDSFAVSVLTSKSGATLSGAGTLKATNGVKIEGGAFLAPGSARRPGVPMTVVEGTSLTFETGASIKFHLGADYTGQLVCAGAIAGASEIPMTVDMQLASHGEWLLVEAASLVPEFKLINRPSGVRLMKRQVLDADGETVLREQIWLTKSVGFSVFIR